MQFMTETRRVPLRLVLATCWPAVMVAAMSCSGHATTTPNDDPAIPNEVPETLDSTSTAEHDARKPDDPDPFVGMWDPNPAFPGKRQLEGILHIEHPCVYLLGHADWDAILIGLPREQTDYDAVTESITVSGRGSVTSGRRVTAMGNYYNRPQPSDACQSDAIFNAWQLAPSTDPFVGMYDHPEDEPAPSYYRIGILLIEPPCAFLVSRTDWRLSGSTDDSHLEAEVLLLARNTIRYDPYNKSIKTDGGESLADGDVVVVGPGVGRENRYGKICPGDWDLSADYVIRADEDAYLSVEERRYVESLRRDASALFPQTVHQRPCERLGVCPTTALRPPMP